MTTLTIQIPDSKALEIKKYLKAQGVVISTPMKKQSTALVKLETGLKQAKKIAAGEMKGGTLSTLFNGK